MTTCKKLFAPFLLAALLFAGCKNDHSNISEDITVPVRLADVKLGSISTLLSVTGTVSPMGSVDLKTETSGHYKLQLNARSGKKYQLGDKVSKGEIIIKLEDPEFINSLRIESRKMDLDIKESDYTKQKSLYEKGGVTQSEMQQAEVAYINSKYDYENAQLQLELLNVRAPFDGVIVSLPYVTQSVKVPTGTSVLGIMDYSKLLLQVDFPEKQITTIKVGQQAAITNYNMEGDTLLGIVTQLSPAIDENSRTFAGVLEIDNPRLKFRPGMFVNANIVLKRKENVITIPSEIISKGRRGRVVYTVLRNTAEEKRINIGMETDTETEIISGLEVGDRIVIEGYQMLSNRSKVKVLK